MDSNERQLAETYLAMLNTHQPDLVDQFVAEDYRNHNANTKVVLDTIAFPHGACLAND